MASRITSLMIVYSTVCSGADQRKHQSPASLAFVRGIHRWPVNSPHKGPVTRKMFLLDDVIIHDQWLIGQSWTFSVNKSTSTKLLKLLTVQKLVDWGLTEIITIAQITLSDKFSWRKSFVFRSKFHWSLFVGFQLIICWHWFRYWLHPGQEKWQ